MGIRKALRNPATGIVSARWHVFDLRLRPLHGTAVVVLGGWGTDELYQQGYAPADTRVFELPSAVFVPIAQAPPTSATLYASVARPLYEHIVSARRQLPVGAVLADDVVTLPGGETVDISEVDTSGPVPTIPSEFAGGEIV